MTLRELRGLYGLSLEDIAQMTGVALSAIERIDTGRPVKPDEAMNVRLKLTLALSTPLPSTILHIPLLIETGA
jgi:transcriptional regulator with XRE-family HTH domain